MNRVLAGALTTIIMGLTVWTGLNRSPTSTRPAIDLELDSRFQDSRLQDLGSRNRATLQGATDRIEGLLASVRDGNADSYLGAFGGSLRTRLEREADECGRDAFALRLRRAGLARTSHAIFAPAPDGDSTDAVRITVESTFASRIERQTFRLEHDAGGWLVTEIETARERVPHRALGSLANYEAPEGNPMAGDPVESASDTKEDPEP